MSTKDHEDREALMEDAAPGDDPRPTPEQQAKRSAQIDEACGKAQLAAHDVHIAVTDAEKSMRWDPRASMLALDDAEKKLRVLRKRIEEIAKL